MKPESAFVRIFVPLIALILVRVAYPAPPTTHEIRFVETTEQAGLVAPLVGIMGHGGAWGDFDGDGRVDLFVGGFCDRPSDEYAPAKGPVPPQLLRQSEPGKFTPVSSMPINRHARTSGAVFTDLNNDGRPELYVANNGRPKSKRDTEPQRSAQLQASTLITTRDDEFVDITDSSGAVPDGLLSARNVVPLDYDRDGLLDLLVVEDRFDGEKAPRTVLLRNLGKMRFEVANDEADIPDDVFGLGAAVADINEDGYPDVFVPHSNRMFISDGDGTYSEPESLRETFQWKPIDGEDWPCGAAFGDLNNDGRLDLVLSIHHVRARNRVYLNEGVKLGVPRFRDVTDAAGLGTPVPVRCPHVELQDFDNDGRLDIYMSAAWRSGNEVTPLVYRNTGNDANGVPTFIPPRAIPDGEVPPRGAEMVYYPAGPTADYDQDGWLDIFLINWFKGDRCRLLRNATAANSKRRWLTVRVRGKKAVNADGIGAQVRVYRAGHAGNDHALTGFQEVAAGYGYASGQVPVCHFGLDYAPTVDVMVTLPDGRTIVRRGVRSNQHIVIEEP